MFHLSTIDPPTLGLLKKLMYFDEFANLRLVGGTALALQLGHRKSIDLDLFGDIDFENINTARVFAGFNNIITLKRSKNINIFSIDDIKVEFVNYPYPWLHNQLFMDEIRLASIQDIAAMKLAAITGSGSRKDFVDLYFLLQKYNLKEMFGFYNEKYFDGSEYLVLKSLTYFADAEDDINVEMIKDVSWKKIKEYILDAVKVFNQRL